MAKPPDFSLGYTAKLDLLQQPPTLSASVTLGLNSQQLREVGAEAARAAGLPFDDIAINVERDASDEPAYFFIYMVCHVNNVTGGTRSRLSRELRDRLLALGDAHYPYVKLTVALDMTDGDCS